MEYSWPKGIVIVVDMWNKPHLREDPSTQSNTEIKHSVYKSGELFYPYLNYSLKNLANNGYQIFMHNTQVYLNTFSDYEWPKIDINDYPKYNHDPPIYFCGQHLNRCINKCYNRTDANNKGIILNLSLPFPEDDNIFKNEYNFFFLNYNKLLKINMENK